MQMNQPEVALSGAPRAIEIDAVLVQDAGHARALERDRRKALFALSGLTPAWITSILTGALGLVVHLHRAMERAAVVVAGIDIFQEVRRR